MRRCRAHGPHESRSCGQYVDCKPGSPPRVGPSARYRRSYGAAIDARAGAFRYRRNSNKLVPVGFMEFLHRIPTNVVMIWLWSLRPRVMGPLPPTARAVEEPPSSATAFTAPRLASVLASCGIVKPGEVAVTTTMLPSFRIPIAVRGRGLFPWRPPT